MDADSESLIRDNQYDARVRLLYFLLRDDFETTESGVSLFPVDLFALASDMGVVFPTDLGAGLAVDFAGMDSRLGGFADFSLPERSSTPTLLLTLDAILPLNMHASRKASVNTSQ